MQANRKGGNLMTWQRFNAFAISCVLFGLTMSSSGQAQSNFNFPRPGGGLPAQQATAKQNAVLTSPETSYTYTLFDFPGTLSSGPNGIVVSGKSSKLEIVGGYGGPLQGISTGSFRMHYTVGKTTTSESYQNIAIPGAPAGAFQGADGVNKAGTIVGVYSDASGNEHGWRLTGTTFSTFDVPFQGGCRNLGQRHQ
jgi:hypothetical protein